MTDRDPYAEGYDAWLAGAPESANPFEPDSDDFLSWNDGWNDAADPSDNRPEMTVIDEIAAERRRQIEVEGWTPEHDDQHTGGELAQAARCYAMDWGVLKSPPASWPWQTTWWKPKDRRRDLIRAAALIVAEIERLDRALARAAKET